MFARFETLTSSAQTLEITVLVSLSPKRPKEKLKVRISVPSSSLSNCQIKLRSNARFRRKFITLHTRKKRRFVNQISTTSAKCSSMKSRCCKYRRLSSSSKTMPLQRLGGGECRKLSWPTNYANADDRSR